MTYRYSASTLFALLVVLSGCGGLGSSAVTNSSAPLPPAAQAAGGAKEPFVFVGGTGLAQFPIGSAQPRNFIKPQPAGFFHALVLDHSGHLIGAEGVSAVTIFDARTLERVKTLSGTYPSSVAVDRYDDIYVANCGGAVDVYSPGGKKRVGFIADQAGGACALASDPEGNIYVVDSYHEINVYAPEKQLGKVRLLRRIRQGLDGPVALAFGPNGEIFVANYPPSGKGGSVSVYAHNGGAPLRTISERIALPSSLAVDAQGTLYVASVPGSWHRRDGWVSVYAPGSTQLLHRITRGISAPGSLALDASGDLYVANLYEKDVTVYSNGGTALVRTLRKEIVGPDSLVIGE